MSSGLITLHLTATSTVSGTITTTTTSTITPLVKRFTATVVIGNILSGVTTIPSTSFKDDFQRQIIWLSQQSFTRPNTNKEALLGHWMTWGKPHFYGVESNNRKISLYFKK